MSKENCLLRPALNPGEPFHLAFPRNAGIAERPCCPLNSFNITPMKVNVVVKPKEAVLDPQGAAVRDAMRHLGMPEVRSVRIGKFMEIEVDGDTPDWESKLHGLCRDLLSNPVIEDYEWQGHQMSTAPKR
jgi:phosphoribosylformylglycinamidine synthase subunit PurS